MSLDWEYGYYYPKLRVLMFDFYPPLCMLYVGNLRTLDLCESEVDDLSGDWISHFPDSYTSLESLNVACLGSELRFSSLERLVCRCPKLKSLRLNRAVPLEKLPILLEKAPQLIDFGTGSFLTELNPEAHGKLSRAFAGSKGLKGLTSLNLSYATIHSPDLIKLLSHCQSLQRLWVLDYIEDSGLEVIAESCKDLRELRVFPSEPYVQEPNVCLTEQGLVSIAMGCPNLQSVLYFCRQMSNEALFAIAKNRPNLTRFRLCIIEPQCPDYLTNQPLDEGFGAIVEHCKDLRRLSLSGLLTDRVFDLIGTHAKKLEMLSLAFAGESDLGLHNVLSGCKNLRKLEIRDCPFGGRALLVNAAKLETMRSLWMSSCQVSYGECKLLGRKMPRLNVEVMDERGHPNSRTDECPVEKLYIYRTVVDPGWTLRILFAL
ncbi:Protein TRANSPORT INHIBITOR RESPONSE 1 [Bienertia sinuspersici]